MLPMPPTPGRLGFKPGSQVSTIYLILYLALEMSRERKSTARVSVNYLLARCPTTNHRRIMCEIRDALKKPSVIKKYGKWTIPPAEVKKPKSWYWLERVT